MAGLLLGGRAAARRRGGGPARRRSPGRVPLRARPPRVAVLPARRSAQARVAALDPGRLPALAGDRDRRRARSCSSPCGRRAQRAAGGSRACGCSTAGPAAGGARIAARAAAALARRRRAARASAASCGCRGRSRRSTESTTTSAAAARLPRSSVGSLDRTGRAAAGSPVRSTRPASARRRGLGAGLRAPEAALLRGMVLGQDEAIGAGDEGDVPARRASRTCSRSAARTCCCCARSCWRSAPSLGRAAAPAARRPRCVLVALYVPLTGAGPSIQRAGVMGVAGLVAALAGRPASRWYALGLAAAVTLALNPLAVGRAGWQLSFAAVVGLLALAPALRGALTRGACPRPWPRSRRSRSRRRSPPRRCWRCTSSRSRSRRCRRTCSPPPVVAPVMWLGMVGDRRRAGRAGARGAAGPRSAGRCSAISSGSRTRAAAATARRGAGPPRRSGRARRRRTRRSPRRRARAARRRGRAGAPGDGRRRRALALGAAVAARGRPCWRGRGAPGGAPAPRPGELVVSFLDVGQGDATLLQRDGVACSFDTGPPGRADPRAGSAQAGVRRLDALVLTHAETRPRGHGACRDRAPPPAAGARRRRRLADAGPARAARRARADGGRARGRARPARSCGSARCGCASLAAAAARRAGGPRATRTTARVVAHVRDGPFDLLLHRGRRVERHRRRSTLPHVEALKVAHHGSDDAGPARDARAAPAARSPRSRSAAHNTYGHPTPATLAALRAVPQRRPDRPRRHGAPARARAARMTPRAAGGVTRDRRRG